MESIEDYRVRVLTDLFEGKTIQNAWAIWSPEVEKRTSKFSDAGKVLDLGDCLSEIFTLTAEEGRGQGVLSAAGTAWEGLVTLYLNMVLSGTNAVAMKQKKSLVPQCIFDATSINYHNDPTNTESDVVVLTFPPNFQFTAGGDTVESLSDAIAPQLGQFELGIIQCKTNWNDNAQIPMLWDLVYRSKGFDENHITVGQNGHHYGDLKKFSYSFVTVPSQKTGFKSTSMAVKRVRNLTGGNYWGQPTQKSIAFSMKEIFSKNFRSAFEGKAIRTSIADAIATKRGAFSVL
jgi:hypothetical protein